MNSPIIVFLFAVATGVLIEGPCPVLPPSHRLNLTVRTFRVVGKASYSNYFDSYLFGKRVEESCEFTLYDSSWISMSERHITDDCPIVHGYLTNLSASIYPNDFKAQLYLKNKGINGKVPNSEVCEVLQIYLLGNRGVVVTSCQVLPRFPTHHDVGLLVGLLESSSKKYVSEVKDLMPKYFGESLIKMLKWEEGLLVGNETIFCRASSNCIPILTSIRQEPFGRGYYKYFILLPISFSLIGIYKILKFLTRKENKVNPVLD